MDSELKLSPGHIAVLWRLILITNKYTDVKVKEATNILKSLGSFGGTIPTAGAIRLGLKYEIIQFHKGKIQLTDFTINNLLTQCNEEEINLKAGRVLLKRIIIRETFEWLVYYQQDTETFKNFIPLNWQQLFQVNGLLNFTDETVIVWWKEVFYYYRKYKESELIKVGNIAEKLSFDHENTRLLKDGFIPSNIDFKLKWVASLSDKYGYDIGSIRSQLLLFKYNSEDNIQIEVKGQQAIDETNFIFYLTNNEWNTAKKNIETYFFYCWISINTNNKTGIGPFIVPAKLFIKLVPTNNSSNCEWVKCRIVINLQKFSIHKPK